MAGKRTRHRRDEGGYARGDETRDAIVRGALAVFGEQGYEGASTRKLVEPSGANPASIQYYFGGKFGLYRACAEYLATLGFQMIDESARLLDDISLDSGTDVLIDALVQFFGRQERSLSDDTEMAQWYLFLARAQIATDPEIFDIVFERFNEPLLVKFGRVVSAIIGKPADHPETRLRTSMILSLISGMRTHGQVTLRFLGWPDFAGARERLLESAIRANLRAMLSADFALWPENPVSDWVGDEDKR